LFPREDGPAAWSATQTAAKLLIDGGVAVVVPARLKADGIELPEAVSSAESSKALDGLDVAIALGGDGTLLRCSRWVAEHGAVLLGINLGDLGFMTAYGRDRLEHGIEQLLAGRLVSEPRLRMRVELIRDGAVVMTDHGSNDAYVKHGVVPRLLQLTTMIGGARVSEHRADGIIACTPLGSTAYNLAAGGPIVAPGADAFTLTPICAHSLTHRPVVLSARDAIEIGYLGPTDISAAFLTIDGQHNVELQVGDRVRITAAADPLWMVPPEADVFEVLKRKLSWDARGAS
jgi:NAD+ kinase